MLEVDTQSCLFSFTSDHYTFSSGITILVFSPTGNPFVRGSPCFNDVIERFIVTKSQDGGGGSGGGDVVGGLWLRGAKAVEVEADVET
ncbi:hypothetical protein Ddye_021196 [Dipteronia dyeriana]|uniref:Uncharacterized protein n=1 Tax=Dipteronia dyeriana TaxID=168575 RepID=A0AAD9U181_9ROSI|nr:hypothetical protein Ddye_021196 [Dipteronia dyeriana]